MTEPMKLLLQPETWTVTNGPGPDHAKDIVKAVSREQDRVVRHNREVVDKAVLWLSRNPLATVTASLILSDLRTGPLQTNGTGPDLDVAKRVYPWLFQRLRGLTPGDYQTLGDAGATNFDKVTKAWDWPCNTGTMGRRVVYVLEKLERTGLGSEWLVDVVRGAVERCPQLQTSLQKAASHLRHQPPSWTLVLDAAKGVPCGDGEHFMWHRHHFDHLLYGVKGLVDTDPIRAAWDEYYGSAFKQDKNRLCDYLKEIREDGLEAFDIELGGEEFLAKWGVLTQAVLRMKEYKGPRDAHYDFSWLRRVLEFTNTGAGQRIFLNRIASMDDGELEALRKELQTNYPKAGVWALGRVEKKNEDAKLCQTLATEDFAVAGWDWPCTTAELQRRAKWIFDRVPLDEATKRRTFVDEVVGYRPDFQDTPEFRVLTDSYGDKTPSGFASLWDTNNVFEEGRGIPETVGDLNDYVVPMLATWENKVRDTKLLSELEDLAKRLNPASEKYVTESRSRLWIDGRVTVVCETVAIGGKRGDPTVTRLTPLSETGNWGTTTEEFTSDRVAVEFHWDNLGQVVQEFRWRVLQQGLAHKDTLPRDVKMTPEKAKNPTPLWFTQVFPVLHTALGRRVFRHMAEERPEDVATLRTMVQGFGEKATSAYRFWPWSGLEPNPEAATWLCNHLNLGDMAKTNNTNVAVDTMSVEGWDWPCDSGEFVTRVLWVFDHSPVPWDTKLRVLRDEMFPNRPDLQKLLLSLFRAKYGGPGLDRDIDTLDPTIAEMTGKWQESHEDLFDYLNPLLAATNHYVQGHSGVRQLQSVLKLSFKTKEPDYRARTTTHVWLDGRVSIKISTRIHDDVCERVAAIAHSVDNNTSYRSSVFEQTSVEFPFGKLDHMLSNERWGDLRSKLSEAKSVREISDLLVGSQWLMTGAGAEGNRRQLERVLQRHPVVAGVDQLIGELLAVLWPTATQTEPTQFTPTIDPAYITPARGGGYDLEASGADGAKAPVVDENIMNRVKDMVVTEAKEMAIRASVDTMKRTTLDLLRAFLARRGTPAEFLGTDGGKSLVAVFVGTTWAMVQGERDGGDFGATVARELRVQGTTDLLGGFVQSVVAPVLETARVRLPALTTTATTVSDTEELELVTTPTVTAERK